MRIHISAFIEQFNNLELDDIGQWSSAVKIVLLTFIMLLILAAGYALIISRQAIILEKAVAEETRLKHEYQAKYNVSANLELFEQQMISAQLMFEQQLKNLPESHEIPGLLDDITFVGTTSGLDFSKLNWQPEIKQEIYIELPINIQVLGSYHEFGQFVSRIAGLPRIVTLHNFTIKRQGLHLEELKLTLQAKTYRYQQVEIQ